MSQRRILIAALLAAGATACSGHAGDARQNPPIPVIVAPVAVGTVPVVLSALGTVESAGSVAIQTRVDGQIKRVFVRDGQEVRAGQALLQIDPEPFDIQLRLARATLARDAAQLENARARAEHGSELIAQKFISEDAYTQLRTDLASAAASVQADRATVDNARLQLSYATIVAPIAGKLSHIAQQIGNTIHVANAASITTLQELDNVDVSFAVPAQDLGLVRAAVASGAPQVTVTSAASAAPEVKISGKLSFVDNSADPATGTIRLRARIDNRHRVLWPGEFVTVALSLPSTPNATTVPAAAVEQGPNGPYVFVITPKSTAEQRSIVVARTTAALAIVLGVQPGEQVVVDGQSRLTPNAQVSVQQAAPGP
jgi:multidrug efflux system membrane fusion protein